MLSIIINSTHLTVTVNNSTLEIEFERSKDLTDKYISLNSASLYFSWRNITNIKKINRILALMTLNFMSYNLLDFM